MKTLKIDSKLSAPRTKETQAPEKAQPKKTQSESLQVIAEDAIVSPRQYIADAQPYEGE